MATSPTQPWGRRRRCARSAREVDLRIAVVGCGVVGLTNAIVMAEAHHDVVALEKDPDRREALVRGHPPFHEPGVPAALQACLASGRLRFARPPDGLQQVDVVVVAVGTPWVRGASGPDLTTLEGALHMALEHAPHQAAIAIRSTCPPGTHRSWADRYPESTHRIAVVPEFIREGSALADARAPSRLVLGTHEPATARRLGEALAPPDLPARRVLQVGPAEAELAKVASNAYLAVRLSFLNDLSRLAGALGADILPVAQAMGLDPRIGPTYLHPGPGLAGSCLPKDLHALAAAGRRLDTPQEVASGAAAADARHVDAWATIVLRHTRPGDHLTVWGGSFKAQSDDLREAVARRLVPTWLQAGRHVAIYDPHGEREALKAAYPGATVNSDPIDALADANAFILHTASEPPGRIEALLSEAPSALHTVFDLRRHLDVPAITASGRRYLAMGYPG